MICPISEVLAAPHCGRCGTEKTPYSRNDRINVRWYCKPCQANKSSVRRKIDRGELPVTVLATFREPKLSSYPMPVLDSMPIEQLFNRIADLLIGNPGQHKVVTCKDCGRESRMLRCYLCHIRHRSLLAVKNGNERRSAGRRIGLGGAA